MHSYSNVHAGGISTGQRGIHCLLTYDHMKCITASHSQRVKEVIQVQSQNNVHWLQRASCLLALMAFGQLLVLRGAGNNQGFLGSTEQQMVGRASSTLLLRAGSHHSQLKDPASCHCYHSSPGISSKWI